MSHIWAVYVKLRWIQLKLQTAPDALYAAALQIDSAAAMAAAKRSTVRLELERSWGCWRYDDNAYSRLFWLRAPRLLPLLVKAGLFLQGFALACFFLVLVQAHPSGAVVIFCLIPFLLTTLVALPALLPLWAVVSTVGTAARPELVQKTLRSQLFRDVDDPDTVAISSPTGVVRRVRLRPATGGGFVPAAVETIARSPSAPMTRSPSGARLLGAGASLDAVPTITQPLPPPPRGPPPAMSPRASVSMASSNPLDRPPARTMPTVPRKQPPQPPRLGDGEHYV
jgi:hypothetical protein